MQFSYSRVECFKKCPYQFKLHYIDELETIREPWPDDALIIGSALHKGIETDVETGINEYYNQFPVINDNHINEAIKLEILIPKVKSFVNQFSKVEHEVELNIPEFKGFIDLMVYNEDGTVDIYDFKYSNNIDNYMESAQLHIYKAILIDLGYIVRKLGFVFIPKTSIRQKNSEDLYMFRKRLIETVSNSDIQVKYVDYSEEKVKDFLRNRKAILNATNYNKQPSHLCEWCEYQKYCEEEIDYMLLPKNERREVKVNTMPDMWLYGESYSGKTVFMDSFDNVLMLNTDGNIDHISSPVMPIKDEVTVEGRITKRKYAWEVFEEVVCELEKKENDFQTVIIDLVEDLYEHCRLYMYNKLGIEHEQDAGYGKGWDMVRTEFLSKIKRLKNCGYQIVYISKVVTAEVTKKNGEKITTIKPNINDKVANVLSGTVDLTARVIADGNERLLSFKTSPYIFGGSRYNFGVDEIALNKEVFIETLKKVQTGKQEPTKKAAAKQEVKEEVKVEEQPQEPVQEVAAEPQQETKIRRSRRQN